MANKGKATENKRKVKVFKIVIDQFVIHRRALPLTISRLGKIYSGDQYGQKSIQIIWYGRHPSIPPTFTQFCDVLVEQCLQTLS